MTEAAAPPAKRFCAEDRGSNEAMEGTENAPNSEIAEDITKESEVTESGMVRASRASAFFFLMTCGRGGT